MKSKFPIQKFDSNGNRIYYENSSGYWEKREFDSNGNLIYYEDSTGSWFKQEYDSNGNEIYYEDSDGYWVKREYDSNGNEIYSEDSNGYWSKREYDSNGNEIYYENSNGKIIDKRPKISTEIKEKYIRILYGCVAHTVNTKLGITGKIPVIIREDDIYMLNGIVKTHTYKNLEKLYKKYHVYSAFKDHMKNIVDRLNEEPELKILKEKYFDKI